MQKVIGIGETILDIIFQNDQPLKAVPGGSAFNCMVSLGRCRVPAFFISEMGQDRVGGLIGNFMQENNLSTKYIDFFANGKSPVSLAFLNESQNAEYVFYRDFPEKRLDIDFPEISESDVLVLSSYFAVNSLLRDKVASLLSYANQKNAIIYYDINFRKPHAHERLKLMDNFKQNFSFATIVRCSDEDLEVLFPGESIDVIYQQFIAPNQGIFIVTRGEKGIFLKTKTFEKEYFVNPLNCISTIGAGDNFNAGLIYGIMKYNFLYDSISQLSEPEWDQLIGLGKKFAAEVCMSYDNYISSAFAKQYEI